uniref:Uncharacterized protein n=1 Tax=Candidatus Kentrum sp. DK TaxID=2126562 RepID=A0A450SUP0_9GAMM|nr:MAG: hypothetical protein BECKDK2373C_GA0170839_10614 [Candidatus Kentron sp. DK]
MRGAYLRPSPLPLQLRVVGLLFHSKTRENENDFLSLFSAHLCELCASAVKKEEIATAEAQSSQRCAEKRERIYGLLISGCSWGKDEACRRALCKSQIVLHHKAKMDEKAEFIGNE